MDVNNEQLTEDYKRALEQLNNQQYRAALNSCRKILKSKRGDLNVINLLAICAHHLKKFKTTTVLYDYINKLSPNNPVYLSNQGSILRLQGDISGAILAYRQAIAAANQNPELYFNLAQLYEQTKQPMAALECYEKVLSIDPNNIQGLLLSGILLQRLHQERIAIKAFKKALSLNPNHIPSLLALAVCLQSMDLHTEAVGYYYKILNMEPEHFQALVNLGVAYRKIEKYDESVKCYEKAMQISPNVDYVYSNLANVLTNMNDYEAAIKNYHKAIDLNPNLVDAYNGLGFALHCIKKFAEAEKYYLKALSMSPDLVDAHFNLALNLLMEGRFKEGWEEYEWRTRKPEMITMIKKIPYPLWDGSPLGNRTLGIFAEQGYGDNIQFIRYVPLIEKQNGKIILAGRPELTRLFSQIPAIDEFNTRGAILPNIDCYIPLLSLPRLFHTTMETIPADIPYLNAFPADSEAAKKFFPADHKALRIGICWTGSPTHKNTRNRSANIENFASLANPKVELYSLQKSPMPINISSKMPIVDLSRELTDFAATAALIANLDLIITVDTSIAHLAGAMGKPVWNLLAYTNDWRWLGEGSTTLWYPTMRLYRQDKTCSWDPIFKKIKKDLKALLNKKKK